MEKEKMFTKEDMTKKNDQNEIYTSKIKGSVEKLLSFNDELINQSMKDLFIKKYGCNELSIHGSLQLANILTVNELKSNWEEFYGIEEDNTFKIDVFHELNVRLQMVSEVTIDDVISGLIGDTELLIKREMVSDKLMENLLAGNKLIIYTLLNSIFEKDIKPLLP